MGNHNVRHVLLECQFLDELRSEMMEELHEAGVSTVLGEDEMLKKSKAATTVAKFMIATGLLGQFQSVDSVATGREQGEEDQHGPTNKHATSAGEQGSKAHWPGTRSAEVTSHQRTLRSANADDEDDETWRRDPNLFVYNLPA
ncbi:uncharacterized protein PGRI_095940 [Penicillium griseofulvum]|uniref:Uncharacterized protein n=2 Tax=Penicillium TaxID=5073 RepID=A0A135L840_PENPA|nr:uncharacterized protein PGRI_095940 [Penicillium griseofulvum]KXG45128.1 hypothetical protein PGRI_095940 [Penicillium griseofulvum]